MHGDEVVVGVAVHGRHVVAVPAGLDDQRVAAEALRGTPRPRRPRRARRPRRSRRRARSSSTTSSRVVGLRSRRVHEPHVHVLRVSPCPGGVVETRRRGGRSRRHASETGALTWWPWVAACPRLQQGEDRSRSGDPRGRDPRRAGARAGRQADRARVRRGGRARRRSAAPCTPTRSTSTAGADGRRRRPGATPTWSSRCSRSTPPSCAGCRRGTATVSFLPANAVARRWSPTCATAASRRSRWSWCRASRGPSRWTRCRSQALVAGYRCAIVAAGLLRRFFPLNMTAAGTVPPAEVVVLGAGVAGLQAIATCEAARRGRQGVRRPRRRRRGDPLDGRQGDRARARDARGRRRLRPRDDRGPRRSGSASCSRRTSPPPTR